MLKVLLYLELGIQLWLGRLTPASLFGAGGLQSNCAPLEPALEAGRIDSAINGTMLLLSAAACALRCRAQ